MKKSLHFGLCAAFVLLSLVSCKKEDPPVPGCMDPNSMTYNSLATEDDGSCEYPDKFLPMAVGNHWLLSDSIVIPFVGGAQVDANFTMYGDTTIGDTHYFLMSEVITAGTFGELSNKNYLYRQARTGELYRQELVDSAPEGLFLEYPLDLGVSWYDTPSQDGFFFEVFSRSIISVPAANFNNCVGVHATDLGNSTTQDLYYAKDGGLIRVDIEFDFFGTPITAQLELEDYTLN